MTGIPQTLAALKEQSDPRLMGKPAQAQHVQDHSIKVDVNLVLVPVTVTDRMGKVVHGLDRENFRLFDDKVLQQIAYFSNEDVPGSVGLLFDSSGSMSDKM